MNVLPLLLALAPLTHSHPAQLSPSAPDGLGFLHCRRELDLEGLKALGLAARDTDGDGTCELYVTTQTPGTLSWWPSLAQALAGASPNRVEIGAYPLGPEWDEDRAAWLVASQAERTLLRVERDEEGRYRASTWATLPETPRVLVANVHLGSETARAAVVTESHLCLVSERVEGEPAALERLALPAEDPTCALRVDGGAALLVGFQATRELFLAQRGPDGIAWTHVASLQGIPRDMLQLDLDSDGDDELVVAGGPEHLWVFGFDERGSAPWECTPRRWTTESIPISLAAADWDHDGMDELAVAHHSRLQVQFLDDFTADGPTSVTQVYSGQTPWDLVLEDLDGDGSMDVAVTNRDAYRVGVLLGRPTEDSEPGPPTTEDIALGRAPHHLAVADFDADGREDVAASNSLENTISILLERDGTWKESLRIEAPSSLESIQAGDLDGDGDGDLALLSQVEGRLQLEFRFSDGAGNLREYAGVPSLRVGSGAGDLCLMDLDGDGVLEIAAVDEGSGILRVWWRLSDAGSTLVLSAPLQLEVSGGPNALFGFELGSSGPKELGISLSGSHGERGLAIVAIEPSPAGGQRLVEIARVGCTERPVDFTAGDLNGDGRSDLVLLLAGNSDVDPGKVAVWMAQEKSGWTRTPDLGTGLHPYALLLADLDGDGADELMVSAEHSHHVNLWSYRGDQLVRLADLGAGTGCLELAAVRVGPGMLPVIVVANHFSDDLSVIR